MISLCPLVAGFRAIQTKPRTIHTPTMPIAIQVGTGGATGDDGQIHDSEELGDVHEQAKPGDCVVLEEVPVLMARKRDDRDEAGRSIHQEGAEV